MAAPSDDEPPGDELRERKRHREARARAVREHTCPREHEREDREEAGLDERPLLARVVADVRPHPAAGDVHPLADDARHTCASQKTTVVEMTASALPRVRVLGPQGAEQRRDHDRPVDGGLVVRMPRPASSVMVGETTQVGAVRTIPPTTARRLAVRVSSSPVPPATADGILDTVRRLGRLQLDPTSVVARSHLLVLWSRLGAYDPADLDALQWERRELFEYRAYIVPTSDYALVRARMKAWPAGDSKRHRDVREWMRTNDALRRSILARLRRNGPLRLRDLDGAAAAGWRSAGWNDERERRPDARLPARAGEGARLAARGRPPPVGPRRARAPGRGARQAPVRDVALASVERDLRRRPAPRRASCRGTPGDPHPRELLPVLVRRGRALPVEVEGLRGPRYLHADHLPLLERLEAGEWEPRTTLLSPFDPLINDRDRTEALFGFRYRLEIYVPKAKREYGYFVLPILHGDRLVGRIDPVYDRKARKARGQRRRTGSRARRAARGPRRDARSPSSRRSSRTPRS